LSREELFGEELFRVSVSHSVSIISHLEHRAAHKLARFVDAQYLSFLLNHVTENPQILNNFSLEFFVLLRVLISVYLLLNTTTLPPALSGILRGRIVLNGFFTCESSFRRNPIYVICEVRQRFNVYQCNFLDETSEKKFMEKNFMGKNCSGKNCLGKNCSGKNCSGKNCLGKNCLREELLLGRIALGKNCSWEELSGKNCLGKNSPGRTDNIREKIQDFFLLKTHERSRWMFFEYTYIQNLNHVDCNLLFFCKNNNFLEIFKKNLKYQHGMR
jgi:hypothetical protein